MLQAVFAQLEGMCAALSSHQDDTTHSILLVISHALYQLIMGATRLQAGA